MAETLFLQILKTALRGEKLPCDSEISSDDMDYIVRLSELHRVLPLVFDCVYPVCPYEESRQAELRRRTKLLVMQQTVRTEAFLNLYRELQKKGLEPVVVKGIICRSIYPNPDFRFSADEDMLILSEESAVYDEALRSLLLRPQQKRSESYYETSYFSDEGLHIEVHTSLFSTEISYFDEFNSIFENLQGKTDYIQIEDVKIRTLTPTYHLLFLILHALKHFVHSGVGIRQVCDMIMTAQHYGKEIDWDVLVKELEKIGAEGFAAGVFAIGEKYLGFDMNSCGYPEKLKELDIDEKVLLRDILCAGVYGGATMSRRHSGGVTLSAVEGEKSGLAHRLFPKRENLDSRYDYAKKNPLLLPAAWIHRIINYMGEVDAKEGNTPSEAIRTGKLRISLLKELGILPENKS